MNYNIQIDGEGDEEIDEILAKNLKEYNISKVGFYKREKFTIYIKDNDEIIAGAQGNVLWDVCTVNLLWVSEKFRHQVLGSKLMHRLEAHAKFKNCKIIQLNTAEFQAKDFYLKIGFKILASIEKGFLGHTQYIMQKII